MGAHTKFDLKVHLVWVPKYRKKVLLGGGDTCARFTSANCYGARAGDCLWEGSTRSRPPIHRVSSDAAPQPDCAVVEGDQLKDIAGVVTIFTGAVLGSACLGGRVFGCELRNHHGRDGSAVHRRARRRTGSGRQSISNRRALNPSASSRGSGGLSCPGWI